jgi:hypothetical protein
MRQGNFEKFPAVVPDTPAEEIREDFNRLRKKYGGENSAATRAYVSVFIDLMAFVKSLPSGLETLPISEK